MYINKVNLKGIIKDIHINKGKVIILLTLDYFVMKCISFDLSKCISHNQSSIQLKTDQVIEIFGSFFIDSYERSNMNCLTNCILIKSFKIHH